MSDKYTFEMTCEAAPTQVEGRRLKDDVPYYFRARHGVWALYVGKPGDAEAVSGKVIAQGMDETYGSMSAKQVRKILNKKLVKA